MTEALRSELIALCAQQGLQLAAPPEDGKHDSARFGLCALVESTATPESHDAIVGVIVGSFVATHAYEHKEGCQWMLDIRMESVPFNGGPAVDFYILDLFRRSPVQQEVATEKAQAVAVA